MKSYYEKPLLCSLWCSICTCLAKSEQGQQQVRTMYHSECVRGDADGRMYCQTAVRLLSDFEGARLPS